MFNEMRANGIEPFYQIYVSMIDGCTRNHFFMSGMKLLREMHQRGWKLHFRHNFILNFRRQLIKNPHLIREIDEMTDRPSEYIYSWRRVGARSAVPIRRSDRKSFEKEFKEHPDRHIEEPLVTDPSLR